MNEVEKNMIEKVHTNIGVSGGTPAIDGENAATCPTCPCENSRYAYDKDEISRNVEIAVESYLERSLDQFETVMADDIHNEVNHRPTAQQ